MSQLPCVTADASSRQIALTFDVERLRKSLRHAFAGPMSVVLELIHNARRAGAQRVDVTIDAKAGRLVVADDGCGVADLAVMLTDVARSAWPHDMQESERPYGAGFLSAIYAARHVQVRSKGSRLDIDTEALLDGRPAVETPDETAPGGTVVTLDGLEKLPTAYAVAHAVRGMPVDIVIDGVRALRPDRLDPEAFVQTEVGWIRLATDIAASSYRVYLQGTCVRGGGFAFGPELAIEPAARDVHIVHLDPGKFTGMFPDRSRLEDSQTAFKRVEAELRRLRVARLMGAKESLTPSELFAKFYEEARALDEIAVFNDLPELPGEMLDNGMTLRRADLAGRGRFVIDARPLALHTRYIYDFDSDLLAEFPPEDLDDDQGVRLKALGVMKGMPALICSLDPGHWIMPHLLRQGEGVRVEVEMSNVVTGQVSTERECCIDGLRLALCDELTLIHDQERTPCDRALLLIVDAHATAVVPRKALERGDSFRSTLLAIDRYSDEGAEDDLARDARELRLAVQGLAAGGDRCAVLSALLRSRLLDVTHELKGIESLRLTLDSSGRVVAVSDIA